MKVIDGATTRWQVVYEMSESMLAKPDSNIWVNEVLLNSEGKSLWSGIRELRTIHMGGGRQNAKTIWTSAFMLENPKAIAIAIDKHLRAELVNMLNAESTTGEDYYRRVFTIHDLFLLCKDPEWKKRILYPVTHVLFNDASYNRDIETPQFRSLMDFVFDPTVTVVMMG